MNLFVLVGPHHLRPLGTPRAPISPIASIPGIPSVRCAGLDDVMAAVDGWARSSVVVAVAPRRGSETMTRWIEMAARLLPARRIVIRRSALTPLGAELAVQELLRSLSSAAPAVLAVEALARLEGELTTGVIHGPRGRLISRRASVEIFSPRYRQLRCDQLRALVPEPDSDGGPTTGSVLRFARHGGADRDLLDQAFPLAWLDLSVEDRPGDLETERLWTAPSIEFATCARTAVSL